MDTLFCVTSENICSSSTRSSGILIEKKKKIILFSFQAFQATPLNSERFKSPLFVCCQGFGEPASEHWLGNEFVSKLTSQQSYKLRIEVSDWEGNSGFSQYDQFSIDSEAQNYRYVLLKTVEE